MQNEEMRKLLNIVLENEQQVDEISAPKWLKGAALAGALGAGLHMTALDNEPFAQWLEQKMEQTQDPVAKAKMKRDYDRFVLSDVEAIDIKPILKKYGWEKKDEVPSWVKEPK